MCSHHLVEPVACTPGPGGEKGPVENQGGTVRGRLFVPRPRGRAYEELNAWLMDQCIREAKRCRHPVMKDNTVWEVLEQERESLMAYRGAFDGFHAVEGVGVSKSRLVRFDNHHNRVQARAVGRPVEGRADAERMVLRQDAETVGEHPCSFRRSQITDNPWHYVPVLKKTPGALSNGAPLKDWELPGARGRMRARLSRCSDGDRQFVTVLAAVLDDGLEAVEAPCAEALHSGVCSADGVLNLLARRRDSQPAPPMETPQCVRLRHPPVADGHRYERLRGASHGTS